jgi:hypothetical protein
MKVKEATQQGTAFAPPPAPSEARTGTLGYWVGAVIMVVGLVAGLVWGWGSYRAYQRDVEAFPRTALPGEAVVNVDGSAERVLFVEGNGSFSLEQLDINVTGPGEASVPVQEYAGDLRYDAPDGTVGQAVGSFAATTAGDYRVTGQASIPGAHLAIGTDVPTSTIASVVGALFLIGGALIVGLIVMVVTAVGRRQMKSRPPQNPWRW